MAKGRRDESCPEQIASCSHRGWGRARSRTQIFGSVVTIITSPVFCATCLWQHCQDASYTFVLLPSVYFLKQKVPCFLWVHFTPLQRILYKEGPSLLLAFVSCFWRFQQWFTWMGFLMLMAFLWHETVSSEQGNIVIIICNSGSLLPR